MWFVEHTKKGGKLTLFPDYLACSKWVLMFCPI
jgi:hypothetical protein